LGRRNATTKTTTAAMNSTAEMTSSSIPTRTLPDQDR
jgi:hypothetical protein